MMEGSYTMSRDMDPKEPVKDLDASELESIAGGNAIQDMVIAAQTALAAQSRINNKANSAAAELI
jgi:predicted house-cleaning NTP pyrophosphatase (Maf/HAM1 superfamily)